MADWKLWSVDVFVDGRYHITHVVGGDCETEVLEKVAPPEITYELQEASDAEYKAYYHG